MLFFSKKKKKGNAVVLSINYHTSRFYFFGMKLEWMCHKSCSTFYL